ncbi:MAG TPA: AlwI family type II restriction endonuclease [Verrucomicrobiae bacterium]
MGFLSHDKLSVTRNGSALLDAKDLLPAVQERFLRSIAAQQFPNPLEPTLAFPPFRPLALIIDTLKILERSDEKAAYISFNEVASILLLNHSPEACAEEILAFRKSNTLEKEYINAKAQRINLVPNTLRDYADTATRYLKATGLFESKGRGFRLIQRRSSEAELIANEHRVPVPESEYFERLENGVRLPTDSRDMNIAVSRALASSLATAGESVQTNFENLSEEALIQERFRLEQRVEQLSEEQWAAQQVNQAEEILEYLDALITKKGNLVPRDERPAYLEWTVWRVFLALDHLETKAAACRRFSIEPQDFLPIGTAPGNGPDLIFEFKEFVLVVEVTFTASSRQEAAEGEPVRRHVANALIERLEKNSDKPVYGLFVAANVDLNTVETFKTGVWWQQKESGRSKLGLSIVPVSLTELRDLFAVAIKAGDFSPTVFKHLLLECRADANNESDVWRERISKHVQTLVKKLHRPGEPGRALTQEH